MAAVTQLTPNHPASLSPKQANNNTIIAGTNGVLMLNNKMVMMINMNKLNNSVLPKTFCTM
jgi:hypothetical protein